jgi:flagella basal body P-ring formation protein FlgA
MSGIISQRSVILVFLLVSGFFLLCGYGEAVAPAQIEDALKAHIRTNYPWAGVEISELVFRTDPPDSLPERIFVERGLPNRTVFILEYGNGTRITATANVKIFDRVIMTRRAFKKGHILHEEDVYETLMDVVRIPKDAVRPGAAVVGVALTRSVLPNMPVVSGMVRVSQAVKKGTRVIITAEAPGFFMSARGELKENSFVGNDVKVLNLDSKRIVTGVLSGENTVKVVF